MSTQVQDKIEREVVYPQPIERVWAALTEPDLVRTWFSSVSAEIDLRPGGAILLIWEDMSARAIVDAVDPPHRFAWRWIPGNLADDRNLPLDQQGPLTLVEFHLEAVEGGTRLRMIETGFAAFEEDQRIQALAQNNGGWDQCFAGLDKLLGADHAP